MQRVAIGRALVRRPKALLMDEPIGALDAKLREEMRTELKRLHLENDATTVYVTHDQVEAMSMADKIAIMNEGVLEQVGTPTEVYQQPATLFVAQFIGSPIMNVVNGAVRPADDHTAVILGEDDAVLSFPQQLFHLVAREAAPRGRARDRRAARRASWSRRQPHRGPHRGRGAHHRAAGPLRHRRPQVRQAAAARAHAERLRRRAGRRGVGAARREADALLQHPHRAKRCDRRL